MYFVINEKYTLLLCQKNHEALLTTISGQDVIENPNEVWKITRQKIEEDPKIGDRYDEAVSKK